MQHKLFSFSHFSSVCNSFSFSFSLCARPTKSPLHMGVMNPIWHNVSLDPTSVLAKWHLNLSNGLSRGAQMWQTTDRQTTLWRKCVAMGCLCKTVCNLSERSVSLFDSDLYNFFLLLPPQYERHYVIVALSVCLSVTRAHVCHNCMYLRTWRVLSDT